jgi:Protein of unknown function (DUF2953)
MNVWVWLGLIVFILVVLMVVLLVSYLRLETFVSEQTQVFRLHWLGNKFVVDAKARAMSWWFFGWRILHKPFKAREPKPKEEKKAREKMSLKPLLEERQRIVELWRYFKRSIIVERLELNARLATPDPLWTGMLYGAVSSIIYPLKAVWPKAQLRLQPDFAHKLPSGTLNVVLGIRVVRIVVLGLKAFRLIRKLRQPRDRKEELYGSSNPSQRTRRGHASSS